MKPAFSFDNIVVNISWIFRNKTVADKLTYIPNNNKQNISLLIEMFANEQTNQNLIKVFKGLNQRIILSDTIVIYTPMSPPSLGKSTWLCHKV